MVLDYNRFMTGASEMILSLSHQNRRLGAGIGTVAREEQARTGAEPSRARPGPFRAITPILASPGAFLVRKAH